MSDFPDVLEFEVTKEHIQKGERRQSSCCMIALAVNGKYPGYFVCVGGNYIYLYIKSEDVGKACSERARYRLDEQDVWYYKAWDAEKPGSKDTKPRKIVAKRIDRQAEGSK